MFTWISLITVDHEPADPKQTTKEERVRYSPAIPGTSIDLSIEIKTIITLSDYGWPCLH